MEENQRKLLGVPPDNCHVNCIEVLFLAQEMSQYHYGLLQWIWKGSSESDEGAM
jgi:hypothetical protein